MDIGRITNRFSFRGSAARLLDRQVTVREIVFLLLLLLCFMPWMSPPVALLLGIMAAQLIGQPYLPLQHKLTHYLLQFAVVGLGFGMNVQSAVVAGRSGI